MNVLRSRCEYSALLEGVTRQTKIDEGALPMLFRRVAAFTDHFIRFFVRILPIVNACLG